MAQRYWFDSIDSTQRAARVLAASDAEVGTTVVAARQDAGVGRLDHRWASPPGGLYLSTVVDPPAAGAAFLPVALGVCLRRALGERFGVRLAFRWPNDLLVPGAEAPARKVAGLLVDVVPAAPGRLRCVVGVGINAGTDPADLPESLRPRVATLAGLAGEAVDLVELERLVGEAVGHAVALTAPGPARERLLAEARAALYGVGRAVRVDGRTAGVIRGISDDGALEIERSGETVHVLAGTIEVE